ncbi:MAG: SIMPL domain-containing protein [Pseudomonadales bacterium]
MNDGFAKVLAAVLIGLGLAAGGYFIGQGFIDARTVDRSVEVKGLAEREVLADTAIWPIQIVAAGDDLEALLDRIDLQGERVRTFLEALGFTADEVSINAPNVVDRQAREYGDPNVRVRFSATLTLTVFTNKVQAVRDAGDSLLELGKSGIVISQENYDARTQYLFNGLNELKPAMVEEATRNAREVASKFAEDSGSRLGKIRAARQGQFSMEDRDSNNPHIKKVRVVSTLDYYLVD